MKLYHCSPHHLGVDDLQSNRKYYFFPADSLLRTSVHWQYLEHDKQHRGAMGTASLGVLFVLVSVYNTIYQYYQTLPLAAYVLAPSGVWLSIATVLIFTIWRMNYERAGRPSFLPSAEEGPPSKWRFPLAALAIIV
jgi:hypothetical protein